MSQSLFYWIIYSYIVLALIELLSGNCLNPYFIGLSILIIEEMIKEVIPHRLNPYFIGLSILMIHD